MRKLYMLVVSFVLSGLGLLVVLAPAVAKAVSQIYISGVQTSGGAGHTTDDFIELFNPSADAVNLKDFKLVKRTSNATTDSAIKSWTEDALIPAYSFYLWANSSYSGILATPDITSSGSVADDNGVALRFGTLDAGQLVDSIGWGQTDNGFALVSGNIPANSVLQRQDLFAAQSVYVASAGGGPRNSSVQVLPVAPVVVDPPPVVVVPPDPVVTPPATLPVYLPLFITEVLPNPSGADEGQEAVELYNPNSVPVDITGWFLDDGSATTPTSSAYELSGSIGAGEYKVVVTPAGSFVLNNTGGDLVQLFSPDKKVVNSVTYTETASENKTYQKFSSGWQWLDPSLGFVNVLPTPANSPAAMPSTAATSTAATNYSGLEINEFYPVFGGSGSPWLEVVNHSNTEIDLSQWQIDVASTHLKKPSGNSIVIENSKLVSPGGFATVPLVNINSTDLDPAGKYWVILYSPDGKSQDAVNVRSIVSRLSYAKFGSLGWQWTNWSPSEENKPLEAPNLRFTEILPAYKGGETDAFVEFQNIASQPIFLGNLKLKIGTKSVWLPDYILQPQEYYAVFAEDLPAVLTTTGKKVLLVDANDKLITSLSYLKAKTDFALMIQEDGKWIWTATPTPVAANVWDAGDDSDSTLVTTKAATKTTTKTASKATTKPASIAASLALPKITNSNSLPPEDTQTQPKKSNKPMWIFGLIAVVLLGLAGVVWFVTKEPEVSES